jgi:hypothetical protein
MNSAFQWIELYLPPNQTPQRIIVWYSPVVTRSSLYAPIQVDQNKGEFPNL